MNYSQALAVVRAEGRVRRAGWMSSGRHLERSSCADFNLVTHAHGEIVYHPWIPADEDAFAEDWQEVQCNEPD